MVFYEANIIIRNQAQNCEKLVDVSESLMLNNFEFLQNVGTLATVIEPYH